MADFTTANNAEVLALLNGKTPGITTQMIWIEAASIPIAWNTLSILAGVDLSGIGRNVGNGPAQGTWYVAVLGKNTLVTAAHTLSDQVVAGNSLSGFVIDPAGNKIQWTSKAVGVVGVGTTAFLPLNTPTNTDICIIITNEDLSACTPLIIGTNWRRLVSYNSSPIYNLFARQDRRWYVAANQGLNDSQDWISYTIGDDAATTAWFHTIIGGDSSGPIIRVHNSKAHLLAMTYGSTGGNEIAQRLTDTQAMIAALGCTDVLLTEDLSTEFSVPAVPPPANPNIPSPSGGRAVPNTVVTVTVKPAGGGDYATLNDALVACQDANEGATTFGFDYVIYCYAGDLLSGNAVLDCSACIFNFNLSIVAVDKATDSYQASGVATVNGAITVTGFGGAEAVPVACLAQGLQLGNATTVGKITISLNAFLCTNTATITQCPIFDRVSRGAAGTLVVCEIDNILGGTFAQTAIVTDCIYASSFTQTRPIRLVQFQSGETNAASTTTLNAKVYNNSFNLTNLPAIANAAAITLVLKGVSGGAAGIANVDAQYNAFIGGSVDGYHQQLTNVTTVNQLGSRNLTNDQTSSTTLGANGGYGVAAASFWPNLATDYSVTKASASLGPTGTVAAVSTDILGNPIPVNGVVYCGAVMPPASLASGVGEGQWLPWLPWLDFSMG